MAITRQKAAARTNIEKRARLARADEGRADRPVEIALTLGPE